VEWYLVFFAFSFGLVFYTVFCIFMYSIREV